MSDSERRPPRPAPVLWDIYEEHLDEAAFLWRQWELGRECAHLTLRELVEGPEERLHAHLDALVLGGRRVAERLVAPALASDDANAVAAAAWVLLHAEDADRSARVFAALASDAPPRVTHSVCRALELALRRDLAPQLEAAWRAAPVVVRCVLFDALARHHPLLAQQQLEACLQAEQPQLRAAALRLVQRSAGLPELAAPLQLALRDVDANVRSEALAAGLVQQLPGVWDVCRREAESGGACARRGLSLLALRARPEDLSLLLERAADKPHPLRRDVLFALGFVGSVQAAEVLLAAIDDKALAASAAEAFAAITGVVIDGPLRKIAEPAAEALDDDTPAPEVLPEDLLPDPHTVHVRRWWESARVGFETALRYQYGQPSTGVSPRAAMWRRPLLVLWDAYTTRRPVAVDTRGWQSSRRMR